jgi:signal transduction histidine kinase/ActR/RegA family two-component response regulator
MAPALGTIELWEEAIRQRNRTTVHRMIIGLAACLIFAPLMGWQTCIIWTACYLLMQEIERQVFLPVVTGRVTEFRGLRYGAGLLALFANAFLFGVIALPAWWLGGPMGGVAGSLLLAAGMINSVINSAGSMRVFVATVLPQFLILLSTPWFMHRTGASTDVIIAAAVAIITFGAFCISTRKNLFQARRAQHRAQALAERKQEETARLLKERSSFLATVAHDLRTPISAILTGAAKIEETDNPSLRRQYAALITDAGSMMQGLLNDLLDHARLEAGRMTIESQNFDIRMLLSQTARLWQAPVKAKGLRLRLEGARTLPRYLRGDPMRLRQILNNLISNALKFTHEGSITLNLRAWPDEQGDYVLLIDIIDTGHGMTSEQMSRLFVPFDQTADGVAAQYGGSGLGLAISRQLVELMQGRLTVRSEPEQGSTFTLSITLPQGEAPSAMAHKAAAVLAQEGLNLGLSEAQTLPPPLLPPSIIAPEVDADQAASLHVLIVDDHAINRRAIQLILQSIDCRMTMAENGLDALNLCQTQRFDVVFMDVRMPELDGRETTRRLRSGGGINAKVPVIAVTADNAAEDVQACLDAGMDRFVSKPLTPTSLLNALQDTLWPAEGEADFSDPAAQSIHAA